MLLRCFYFQHEYFSVQSHTALLSISSEENRKIAVTRSSDEMWLNLTAIFPYDDSPCPFFHPIAELITIWWILSFRSVELLKELPSSLLLTIHVSSGHLQDPKAWANGVLMHICHWLWQPILSELDHCACVQNVIGPNPILSGTVTPLLSPWARSLINPLIKC